MAKQKKVKTYVDIWKSERRSFPQGYCATRVIPDKRFKKPKHKGKEWE